MGTVGPRPRPTLTVPAALGPSCPSKLRLAIHDRDHEQFRPHPQAVRLAYAGLRRHLGLAPGAHLALRWEAWDAAMRGD